MTLGLFLTESKLTPSCLTKAWVFGDGGGLEFGMALVVAVTTRGQEDNDYSSLSIRDPCF